MPSSATITSFYSFSANTKARATQVNTNFSNYRGHIIAIDPNTSTAATSETYDLGSTEYRWRTGYFREIDLKANTSTGQALQIVGDTTAGQGAFHFKHGSNTRARIGGGNNFIDLDTTTSRFDFKISGSTIASINNTGIQRTGLRNSAQGIHLTKSYSAATGTTLSLVATLSITSYSNAGQIGYNIASVNTTTSSGIEAYRPTTSGGDTVELYLYRDGTAASNLIRTFRFSPPGYPTTTVSSTLWIESFSTYDLSLTAGGHTYYLYLLKGFNNTVFNFNGDFSYVAI